jgi:hypothetical protein
LARAKQNIADQEQPWLDSYQLLIADPKSSVTYEVETPPSIIGRNSGSAYASTRYAAEAAAVAAFQNALLFALNGERAHADKAVAVLSSYAQTTLHFDQADPERDLEAAILGWLWVSAAELIRYNGYDWDSGDRQRFDDWIRNLVYDDSSYHAGGVLVTPLVNGAGARGAFGLRTKMAIGIYLDDRAIYDQAVDYFFNGKGNGAPDYYVNPTTGQTWEEGRDQGHAQGGLSRLIECAQMAWTQGDSTLYGWKGGGLQRAIEYIASYNLGNDVPYAPMQPYTLSYASVYPQISSDGRGSFATIYELPYAHFHGALGLDLPETNLAIQHEGVENFSAQNDNPMFASLLYRR